MASLIKWAGWIGLQPVLVLTDHRTVESWAKEVLASPSGPSNRRARWHQKLSRFNLNVAYVPGKDNVVADAMSRWAYPASLAFADVSWHGSEEDEKQMKELIRQELKEEHTCRVVQLIPGTVPFSETPLVLLFLFWARVLRVGAPPPTPWFGPLAPQGNMGRGGGGSGPPPTCTF